MTDQDKGKSNGKLTDEEEQGVGRATSNPEQTDRQDPGDEAETTVDPVPPQPAAPQFGDLSPVLAATSERVQSVILATEQATEKIEAEVKKEAAQYLTDVRERAESLSRSRTDRIASLTEDLMAQAGEVEGQVRKLREALTAATEQLGRELSLGTEVAPPPSAETVSTPPKSLGGADGPGTSPAAAIRAPTKPKPSAASESAASEGSKGRFGKRRNRKHVAQDASAGAQLIALQLSIAGTDRETIAQRLRDDFKIPDPTPILDSLPSEIEPART